MLITERLYLIGQVGYRLRYLLVQPELDPRRIAAGWFKQVEQYFDILPKHIRSEPQSMDERHCERDILCCVTDRF